MTVINSDYTFKQTVKQQNGAEVHGGSLGMSVQPTERSRRVCALASQVLRVVGSKKGGLQGLPVMLRAQNILSMTISPTKAHFNMDAVGVKYHSLVFSKKKMAVSVEESTNYTCYHYLDPHMTDKAEQSYSSTLSSSW